MSAPAILARLPKLLGKRLTALLYPRRCPLCGVVLGADAVQGVLCPVCAPQAARLAHQPPRLQSSEHHFYALSGAGAAYYYAGEISYAILRCKGYGNPWYARELADLVAIRLYGAQPAAAPGRAPSLQNPSGLPLYHLIVPVPPRDPRSKSPRLPTLMALRLGQILGVEVAQVLHATRKLRVQKELTREERLQNTRDAYAALSGVDLTGKRILLVDDVITTGATVSACALALAQAGAFDVFAAAIAVDEQLPASLQDIQEQQKPARIIRRSGTGDNKDEATGHRH